MVRYDFTFEEIELVLEALEARANRRSSMARFYPKNSKRHNQVANKMWGLWERLKVHRDNP